MREIKQTKIELAQKNLKELEESIRKEGFFLAVTYIDKNLQLVVVSKRPHSNIVLKLWGFYIFDFIMPNEENGTRSTKKGIIRLRVLSCEGKINGINKGILKKINQIGLKKDIAELKKIRGR